MPVPRETIRKVLGAAVAMILTAALAFALLRSFRPASRSYAVRIESNREKSAARPSLSNGLVLRRVDLSTALLFDCYENSLENVAPRTDTSRRQHSWDAPPLPLEFVGEESTAELRAWLARWRSSILRGELMTAGELREVTSLLERSKLGFEPALKIGLAASFLDGPEHAAVWYRAAVRAALEETAQFDANDMKATKYLQALAQTAALWRRKDYSTLGQRFAIERRLYPPLSKESRKAGHLVAEMDHYQGRKEEALQSINEVAKENDGVGDLTHEDRVESAWTRGLILAMTRRDSEAIPLLKFVVERHYAGFPHVPEATKTLILSLARSGHSDEAESYFRRWVDGASLDVTERLAMMNEIEEAKAKLR